MPYKTYPENYVVLGCGLDGNPDVENQPDEECYCKIQSERALPQPKPRVAPFETTNFCHDLSLDSPTCCSEWDDVEVRKRWMTVFPNECGWLTDDTRQYAWLLKDLSCLACKPNQQSKWFQRDTVKTVKPPEYEKMDSTCEDVWDDRWKVLNKCNRTR